MIKIKQTEIFEKWFDLLKDRKAKQKIAVRLTRLEAGLLGDIKFFGKIGEIRINYGPGYRIYFLKKGDEVIILLCGGDKSTQKKDIQNAMELAKEIKNEDHSL
ncbi:type II toxin-antitoxin system RelE/ParE family toxin [Bartonella queenslandensis]|uniref:type II toxin-antitoxin system RelE/ParE family toxin n=1 Tax=Bartonella queenslandensis TaxID=481138 RepID=UPI000585833A|nr:type II toxin-antitoxin system RelE/ParE family toxin [Bartonella queenslandensis]